MFVKGKQEQSNRYYKQKHKVILKLEDGDKVTVDLHMKDWFWDYVYDKEGKIAGLQMTFAQKDTNYTATESEWYIEKEIIIAADETGNSVAREKFLQKASEDLLEEENEKLMKLLALQNHMN